MLDDVEFARNWVESRDRAHPRGRQALRRELTLKGIDRTTVEMVLEEREDAVADGSANELAAERLLAGRAAALGRVDDPRLRRQRAYALLARNGFDAEVCREVSARFVAPDDDDPDG
jgi:regulatory protein